MDLNVILAASSKHINTDDTWSTLEEIIRYLDSMVFDHEKDILSQHILAMAPKIVLMKYNSNIIIRTFEYYVTSTSQFNELRQVCWLDLMAFQPLLAINAKSYLYI